MLRCELDARVLVPDLPVRQQDDKPVHQWDLTDIEEAGSWVNYYYRIDQVMSTNLYAVNEDDYIHLVSSIMNWKHVRHVPVEDNEGKLVGLVTSGIMLEYLCSQENDRKVEIKEIMITDPISVAPDTLTTEALKQMKEHKVGCLLVVKEEKLVGIVTEHDFVDIASQLFKELLQKGDEEE